MNAYTSRLIHYPKNCRCDLITGYSKFWGSGGHLTHKTTHAMSYNLFAINDVSYKQYYLSSRVKREFYIKRESF